MSKAEKYKFYVIGDLKSNAKKYGPKIDKLLFKIESKAIDFIILIFFIVIWFGDFSFI